MVVGLSLVCVGLGGLVCSCVGLVRLVEWSGCCGLGWVWCVV